MPDYPLTTVNSSDLDQSQERCPAKVSGHVQCRDDVSGLFHSLTSGLKFTCFLSIVESVATYVVSRCKMVDFLLLRVASNWVLYTG